MSPRSAAAVTPRSAIAASNRLRWPSEMTPSSFRVRFSKLDENGEIDVVLGERGRVLAKSQSFQPLLDIHG